MIAEAPKLAPHAAEIRLTASELAIINNALNEICHGIDLPGFASRIGVERPPRTYAM